MDGRKIEDNVSVVGIVCRMRGVEGRKEFKPSAIGSWPELKLWRLILIFMLEELVLFVYRKDWM